MEIKGRIHCFFEQSGTFKKEFIKLGYAAEDYDIQNTFNQTDNVIDLFNEIEKDYDNISSIFDKITTDDLIIAFFPCTYFETIQQTYYTLNNNNYRNKSTVERIKLTIDRIKQRTKFHILLYKLVSICFKRNLRLIIENPAQAPNYLTTGQNFPPPTIVDKNRMLRGDYFVKPTAYWFFNCEPTIGFSYQKDKKQKIISKEHSTIKRSMISPDYARNFICDFILGKQQHTTPTLF